MALMKLRNYSSKMDNKIWIKLYKIQKNGKCNMLDFQCINKIDNSIKKSDLKEWINQTDHEYLERLKYFNL